MAIAERCVRLPVSIGSSGLARELSGISAELNFRDVLTRGGWYRLGGVVDRAGQRIADDLARWGEAELMAVGDDLHALCGTPQALAIERRARAFMDAGG